MSLASSLKSSAASITTPYVPSCTFSPRGRNRFACNTCTKANGGGPILVKRSQTEGHRTAVFLRQNHRTKLPPKTRYESPPRRTHARRSGVELTADSHRGQRTTYISTYAESWLCPYCFGRNDFDKGYGLYGSCGTSACGDWGARFEVVRSGA